MRGDTFLSRRIGCSETAGKTPRNLLHRRRCVWIKTVIATGSHRKGPGSICRQHEEGTYDDTLDDSLFVLRGCLAGIRATVRNGERNRRRR